MQISGSSLLQEKTSINQFELPNHHYRKLGLEASDVASIMDEVNQANTVKPVQSISFSYNPLLGDTGVISILNNLPKTIGEIGLVDCGMTDISGKELLKCIKELPLLQMLCIEQNNFSALTKEAFRGFSQSNPHVLVVV